MHNLLEQLENNEAVLLMYLAGELPEEDQAEVEQMLTTDAHLAAELQRLRAVTAGQDALLDAADAQSSLPIAEAAAVRNTLRSMRRWRLEHPPQIAAPPVSAGLPYPWWTYPTSAAAMLLLAALVWWGVRPEPGGELVMQPSRPIDPTYIQPSDPESRPQAFAYADPLDQAYLELRSIQELADGLEDANVEGTEHEPREADHDGRRLDPPARAGRRAARRRAHHAPGR